MLNPGIGEAERARQQLRARVRRPLHAPYRVAVISTKGGVGKTTLAACIGFTMADIRGDQVSVIDANPDAGTLADRLTGNTSVTIRHLLDDLAGVDTLTKVTSEVPPLARRSTIMAEGPCKESPWQHRRSTPTSCVSALSVSTGSPTPSR
ncbi:AAA family ATPase [Pseudonocardia sp. WMMC193]|uniref:nucleotide-binding protein n=1 Tax=Pseudonocardia sp. WMMC193 TaxID=2911965 RepID=UPI0035ABAB90